MRISNPLTVAGWGVTTEGGLLATRLQEVAVPVVSSSVCTKALSPYTITDNMLCAGGLKGQDACQGDSGGPLILYDENSYRYVLVGVVSFGNR